MDKKTLYRLFYLPKVIQQKRREIKRIEERLTAISPSLSGMPHGGGVHDKIGEVRLVEIPHGLEKAEAAELEEIIRGYEVEENEINAWIDGIEDVQMQLMMSLRFRERLNWNQVADEVGGIATEDSCRKMIDRYLEKGKGNGKSEK